MLTIIGVSNLRIAKDGRNYFVAEFRPGFGQRAIKRTFWEQFRNNSKGERTEEKYWERASYEEALQLLNSGQAIEGKKVTAKVEAYQLGDKLVDVYSTAVFPDEQAEVVFANQKHPMLDITTGALIEKRKISISAPAKKEPVTTE